MFVFYMKIPIKTTIYEMTCPVIHPDASHIGLHASYVKTQSHAVCVCHTHIHNVYKTHTRSYINIIMLLKHHPTDSSWRYPDLPPEPAWVP